MEKRLHPLFQQNASQPQSRIQTQFDPTPAQLTENFSARNAAAGAAASADTSEFVNEAKLKLNRMAQKMLNFEDRLDNLTLEMRSNHSKVSARMSERGMNETKIENMIEKHNNMIHSFEKKLIQMAKLVEESQSQLINTQSALEDARREIGRLKRI